MTILERTQRKTLERLGIKYEEVIAGWSGSKRWGFRPERRLEISDEDYTNVYLPEREKTKEKREKARIRRERLYWEKEERLESEAFNLGVRRDSRTFRAYLAGDIDEAEARRIGEITRRRHEETNYDALLRAGYSKDDARALMEPNF